MPGFSIAKKILPASKPVSILISVPLLAILLTTMGGAPQPIAATPARSPAQLRLAALNSTQIATIAEQISVRIQGQSPGSGVLLARQGSTYYVLTAAHVVAKPDEYNIITPEGQQYRVNYAQVKKLPGVDLAVLQFTSARDYQLAKLGNSSQVQRGMPTFVAGWPTGGNAITAPTLLFQQGMVSANSQMPQAEGYGLIYTNNTLPGMSGGPVLNANGELVGIHGKGETERAQATQNSEVVLKVGYNLGVPINTFLRLAPSVGIDFLAQVPASTTPPTPPAPTTTPNAPDSSRPGLATSIDDFIAQGSNKLHQGDYLGAIAALDRAITSDNTAADAYRLRALAQMSSLGWSVAESRSPRNREKVLAAEKDINAAIRLDPSSSNAFALRGYLRFILNQRASGSDLDEALRLNPNSGMAYVVRSTLRVERGDNEGAMADATEAIRRDPHSTYLNFAYNNRGVARANLKDIQGAVQDLDQAIRLAPKNALSYIIRGTIKAGLRDFQGSLADLQRGADLAVEQNNSELHRQAVQRIQLVQLRLRSGN
jgi:Tfp pilus assembly protein PilF